MHVRRRLVFRVSLAVCIIVSGRTRSREADAVSAVKVLGSGPSDVHIRMPAVRAWAPLVGTETRLLGRIRAPVKGRCRTPSNPPIARCVAQSLVHNGTSSSKRRMSYTERTEKMIYTCSRRTINWFRTRFRVKWRKFPFLTGSCRCAVRKASGPGCPDRGQLRRPGPCRRRWGQSSSWSRTDR